MISTMYVRSDSADVKQRENYMKNYSMQSVSLNSTIRKIYNIQHIWEEYLSKNTYGKSCHRENKKC
jgi:hypothetical protein